MGGEGVRGECGREGGGRSGGGGRNGVGGGGRGVGGGGGVLGGVGGRGRGWFCLSVPERPSSLGGGDRESWRAQDWNGGEGRQGERQGGRQGWLRAIGRGLAVSGETSEWCMV